MVPPGGASLTLMLFSPQGSSCQDTWQELGGRRRRRRSRQERGGSRSRRKGGALILSCLETVPASPELGGAVKLYNVSSHCDRDQVT